MANAAFMPRPVVINKVNNRAIVYGIFSKMIMLRIQNHWSFFKTNENIQFDFTPFWHQIYHNNIVN